MVKRPGAWCTWYMCRMHRQYYNILEQLENGRTGYRTFENFLEIYSLKIHLGSYGKSPVRP